MMESLISIFSEMKDPRDNRGKKHKLIHVIVLAIYGILCGYNDFANMSYYLKKREPELTKELGLLNGVPSHDTFSAVFRILDPKEFMRLFIKWAKQITKDKTIGNHIAIDGKAVKSATDKVNKGNIPYIVSGFLTDIGISIGQVKVDDKSNEIKAIPELLDLINIEDSTITIDAIGTQTNIVRKIVDKKGHYCLSVKENQRNLYEDISLYFDYVQKDNEEKRKYISEYITSEKGHGRIEKRKYYICERVDFINTLHDWESLKAIGMVTQEREICGEKSIEKHYYILDRVVEASEFATYVRDHWTIENQLHWILDVIFDEDHSTSKKENSIQNLSIIRKIVFNLTKLDSEMAKKTTKKKMIDFQFDFSLFNKFINEVISNVDEETVMEQK